MLGVTSPLAHGYQSGALGLERRLYNLAHNNALAYGLFAVFMALLFGWSASVLMRRPGT